MKKIAVKVIPEYIKEQKLDLSELYLIWSPGMDEHTKEIVQKMPQKSVA